VIVYNAIMKRSPLISIVVITTLITCGAAFAASPTNFAGEYADKKFLNGQAVLQLSLEQNGNAVSIFFSGVRHDGQGAAPEIETSGNVTTNGTVQFKFMDDLKNSGSGTITRAGDDVVLSIKATRVTDPRCLVFYKENMRLKRVKK
jgi:hypothetical protein